MKTKVVPSIMTQIRCFLRNPIRKFTFLFLTFPFLSCWTWSRTQDHPNTVAGLAGLAGLLRSEVRPWVLFRKPIRGRKNYFAITRSTYCSFLGLFIERLLGRTSGTDSRWRGFSLSFILALDQAAVRILPYAAIWESQGETYWSTGFGPLASPLCTPHLTCRAGSREGIFGFGGCLELG